jgi:hypothetical protein
MSGIEMVHGFQHYGGTWLHLSSGQYVTLKWRELPLDYTVHYLQDQGCNHALWS